MRKRSARLTMCAAAVAAMLVAPLGASSAAFAQTAEDGSLNWGIRSSFDNYTGGATQVTDGAVKNATGYSFELVSKRYEAAGNVTDLQFNGTVIYRKYCSIPSKPMEGTCSLDLRFNDPRIVISDAESYLEATVSSKQYQTGETWAPEAPVRIANLYTSSATMTSADGRVNWANIASTLTPEGNKMFSDFYKVGEALDPISLTYAGEGGRPAGDSGKPTLADVSWDSNKDYTDGPHIMVDADPYILVGEPGGKIVLLDENLQELSRTTGTLPKSTTYAYDKTTKTVYFTTMRDRKKLYAVSIVDGRFGEERVVFTADSNISAIGVNAVGEVAAIAVSSNYKTAVLISNATGEFAQAELPSSQDLLGAQYSEGSIWGAPSFDENMELLPMKDNTFVFNPEADPYLNGESSSAKGLLISIDVKGQTPAERAKYMTGSDHGNRTAYVRSIATDGETIYRFTPNAYGGNTTTEILRYADRNVTSVMPVSKTGMVGIAAVSFMPDGTVLLQEGNTGTLQYLELGTFTASSEIPLPNGKNTQKAVNNTFVVRENAIFVPTYDESRGDYREYYVLRKLNIPVQVTAPETPTDEQERLDEIAAKAKELATADARAAVAAAEQELAAAAEHDKELATAKLELAKAELQEAAAKYDNQLAQEKSVTAPDNQELAAQAAATAAAYTAAQQATKDAAAAVKAAAMPRVTAADGTAVTEFVVGQAAEYQVRMPGAADGAQYRVVLHSDPVDLGVITVTAGVAKLTVTAEQAAKFVAGAHELRFYPVVAGAQAEPSATLPWQVVAAPAQPGGGDTGAAGNTGASDNTGTSGSAGTPVAPGAADNSAAPQQGAAKQLDGKQLAKTGAPQMLPLLAAGGALLAVGGGVAVARRARS